VNVPTSDRPRLRADTAVASADGRVTLLTGRSSKEISGTDAVATVLPVLRLLDGSRGRAEIAAQSGVARGDVDHVCALLAGWGMLERQAAADEPTAAVRAYLAARWEIEVDDSVIDTFLDRLSRSVVGVCAAAGGEQIAADLTACGAGSVRVLDPDEVPAVGLDLTIVGGHSAESDDLVRRLRQGGTRVLTFDLDDISIEIGPLFPPEPGPCHRCYRLARAARLGARATGVASGAVAEATAAIAAGLVGQEAVALLTGHAEPLTRNAVVHYALPAFERTRYLLAAEPDCPDRGCALPASIEVELFEAASRSDGRTRPSPASVERNRKKLIDGLVDARPAYPHHPTLALPPVDGAERAAPSTGLSTALSATAVARLLRMTAGRIGDPDRAAARWVASGGNLGSVELFALFGDAFDGYPAGTVFRYDDLGHRLIVTRRRPIRPPAAGELHLVFVGNVGRLAAKYSEFAVRLAHLDAGCALAQLRQVAAHLGLCVRIDDPGGPGLIEDLELLPGPELVTARATVSTPLPGPGER
jgi:hypothetical protein